MKKTNSLPIIPIIPAYNPDMKMVKYIELLIKKGFKKIIVVNDGSKSECDEYFDRLTKFDECDILKHAVNQGKGRALKTAFHYYLNNYSDDYLGVITADCDGQHNADDTLKVAKELINNPESLVLGVRDFKSKDVPFRSKFGNNMTMVIFALLNGKKISDTQTGLRALSNSFIKKCLKYNGEKYEYEINMLIQAVKEKVDIKEVTIKTIYIDDNQSSHFSPVSDSLKIYKVLFGEFFKFSIAGILSFGVDILFFNLFLRLIFGNFEYSIMLSTIVARIISSLLNFVLNKNTVFDAKGNNRKYLLKYYILCIIQMFMSGFFTTMLSKVLTENIAKIIVDTILFIVNYRIQKKYIFNNGGE